MATNGFLSLQTREGCKRWLAILLAAVLVFSCIAQLLSSAGNRIKVESVTFDMRGAEINGDLYYPAGVTDEEKYPAVILAPGAGVVKENLRGLAEELAHRNYVVLNVNPYGNGLSETPVYNENDMGPNQFNIFGIQRDRHIIDVLFCEFSLMMTDAVVFLDNRFSAVSAYDNT